MRSALATIPAVYEVGVDVDSQSIYVGYDAAAGAPRDATGPMLTALRAAGFDPWVKAEGWPAEATAEVLPAR